MTTSLVLLGKLRTCYRIYNAMTYLALIINALCILVNDIYPEYQHAVSS